MAAMEFAKRWEADVDSVRVLAAKKTPANTHTIHGTIVYLPTFTVKINQVQVNIPYMDGLYGPSKRVNQQDDSIWCGCVKIMSIHICRYIYLDISYTYIFVFFTVCIVVYSQIVAKKAMKKLPPFHGLNCQGARVTAGPFKMSAEAMKEAKGKAETAWSLGLCPICRESIKGGKVFRWGENRWGKSWGGGWGLGFGVQGWCGVLFLLPFFWV